MEREEDVVLGKKLASAMERKTNALFTQQAANGQVQSNHPKRLHCVIGKMFQLQRDSLPRRDTVVFTTSNAQESHAPKRKLECALTLEKQSQTNQNLHVKLEKLDMVSERDVVHGLNHVLTLNSKTVDALRTLLNVDGSDHTQSSNTELNANGREFQALTLEKIVASIHTNASRANVNNTKRKLAESLSFKEKLNLLLHANGSKFQMERNSNVAKQTRVV
jgi:hypothetical protein